MKNLIAKTVAGFLILFIALVASLFLPAGTIKYFQGWIYLLVFFVPVLLITIYLYKNDPKLLERRVEGGPIAEKEKSQKAIQSLSSLFFSLVFIIAGFDYRYHWSVIPLYISIFAAFFVVLGLCIVFLVFKENSYTSAIIEVNEEQKVISTGPYRFVRHPMYSGAILMMIFTPIALGSYWAILSVLPLIATIVIRLFEEEKFLVNNLSGYLYYSRKVHYRLIPFIW